MKSNKPLFPLYLLAALLCGFVAACEESPALPTDYPIEGDIHFSLQAGGDSLDNAPPCRRHGRHAQHIRQPEEQLHRPRRLCLYLRAQSHDRAFCYGGYHLCKGHRIPVGSRWYPGGNYLPERHEPRSPQHKPEVRDRRSGGCL